MVKMVNFQMALFRGSSYTWLWGYEQAAKHLCQFIHVLRFSSIRLAYILYYKVGVISLAVKTA